jgi:hypothetical protein
MPGFNEKKPVRKTRRAKVEALMEGPVWAHRKARRGLGLI